MAISNRRQVTLGEVLDAQGFALRGSIYKIMPGIVQAYHAASQGGSPATVDVQPAVNDVRLDTDTGALVFEPWPVIPNVPLGMLQGGGNQIAFALSAGDSVTLLGYDLDPTPYMASGNASNPVDTRRHGGGYWQALPFDITSPGATFADPGPNLVLSTPAGGLILAGQNASNFVALANLVAQELSAIAKAFSTFVPGSGGASFPHAYTSPGNVAAAVLKAQ